MRTERMGLKSIANKRSRTFLECRFDKFRSSRETACLHAKWDRDKRNQICPEESQKDLGFWDAR